MSISKSSANNIITPASVGNIKMAPLPGHTVTLTAANSIPIQTQNLPVSPTSCEESVDFVVNDSKHEQINNLNTEVKAFKLFTLDQLYVLKWTIKDINVQENIPNNSLLIRSLEDELNYLRNKNQKRKSLFKLLKVNHCFPVPAFLSDANQVIYTWWWQWTLISIRKLDIQFIKKIHQKKDYNSTTSDMKA